MRIVIAGAGAIVRPPEHVEDDPAAHEEALARGLEADVLVSSGGVSVGPHDLVRDTLGRLGVEEALWGVAMRPGKPLSFGTRNGTLVFGLPGNPVSSLVCFELYVAPALRRALGMSEVFPGAVEVSLRASVRTARDLTEFVRCRLVRSGEVWQAEPTGTQSSGALRSMSLADCLVVSPPGVPELAAGSRATALLLGPDRALSSRHPLA